MPRKPIYKETRLVKKVRALLGNGHISLKRVKTEGDATLHELMADLTTYLNLDPEQQFRVTAKIKRHVHSEKRFAYFRMWMYSRDGIRSLKGFLREKYQAHVALASLPDEDMVTWDVGSHRFNKNSRAAAKEGIVNRLAEKVGATITTQDEV